MIEFPDGTLRREQEMCRAQLEDARRRYAEDRLPEHRADTCDS
jgi:hypothetical protein